MTKREGRKKITWKDAVKAAALLVQIICTAEALRLAGLLGILGGRPSQVISVTLGLLCMGLGIFLFAGAMYLKDESGLFLTYAFLIFILVASSTCSWITDRHAEYRDFQIFMRAAELLGAAAVPPVMILGLKHLSGYGKTWKELLSCRTAYDRAEQVLCVLGGLVLLGMWIMNFRTGGLFTVSEDGIYARGPGLVFFLGVLISQQVLVMVRNVKSPIRLYMKMVFGAMLVLSWFGFLLKACGYPVSLGQIFCFIGLFYLFSGFYAVVNSESSRYENVLETYLTPELTEGMLKKFGEEEAGLITGSLLHSDLRGFTAQSESLSTEDTVKILSRLTEVSMKAIEEEGGIITEFLGDGLLAVFEEEKEGAAHADRALTAALSIQQEIGGVNAQLKEEGLPSLRLGIGVGSGEFIFGKIGTSHLARLMAVGEDVGDAFGAEGEALGGQVILTEKAVEALTVHPVIAECFSRIDHTGVRQPLYRVTGIAGTDLVLSEKKEELLPLEPPRIIYVAVIEGKHVGAKRQECMLYAIAPDRAVLKTETVLTERKALTFTLSGEFAGQYYGKAGKTGEDGKTEVSLTGVPADMEEAYGKALAARKEQSG